VAAVRVAAVRVAAVRVAAVRVAVVRVAVVRVAAVRVAAVRVAAVRVAAVRVVAVRVAAVRVAATRVAAVREAAVRVATVRVAVRLVGSQSRGLNYSIRWYLSSIQLETLQRDNHEIIHKRPKTQGSDPGNPNRDQNCEPEREIPNPRSNPEGKIVQTQQWKV